MTTDQMRAAFIEFAQGPKTHLLTPFEYWQAGRAQGIEEAAKLMDPYDDPDTLGGMNARAIRALLPKKD